MKIPNFDDTDLGILALALVAVIGLLIGWAAKYDAAVVIGLAGTCATGIAGLCRGQRRKDEADEPKE